MKVCRKCKEKKELDAYYKSGYKDSLKSICKSCCLLSDKIRDASLGGQIYRKKSNNKAKNKIKRKEYRERTEQRIKQREYREINKIKQSEYMQKYRALGENKIKIKDYYSKRKKAKINATPSWLTFQDEEEIIEIYKSCPKGYHVDHIVPLQGKTVCGLHVPWNLQILTAEENLKKGNKI